MSANILKHDSGLLKDEAWHRDPKFRVLGRAIETDEVDTVFPFEFSQQPVYVKVGDADVRVPGKTAIVRDDLNLPLSIMGDRYGLNQYRGYFSTIAQVCNDNDFPVVSVGTLGNGAKAFLSAEVPEEFNFEFAGYSVVKGVLNFGDSVDGSSSMRGTHATGIVVCQNTFSANLLGVPALFAVKHTSNSEVIVDETLRRLDESIKLAADIKHAVERLTNEAYVEAEFTAMLKHNDMLGTCPDEDGRGRTMWQNRYAGIMSRYHADDIAPIRETKMGALMAVQGYEEWVRPVRKGLSRTGRHLDELIFGKMAMSERAAKLIGVGAN